MTDRRPRHSPASRHGLAMVLGPGLAAALALGACGAATPPSPPPSQTPASMATAEPAASASNPSSATGSAPGEVGQTDTEWGRIWDDLPEAFPIYPGATPADEAATGPVSAIFALEDADPRAVATWMQTELERGAYRTEALNGPFEDGSFVLELAGSEDCRIEVSVAPLGGLTTVTVRYGAACPSP